jgi:hypothetical protein
MKMSRLAAVGTVFLIIAVGGCGSDGIGNITPPPLRNLTMVSGDNQSAPAGRDLPLPLTVSVTSANGAALIGVPVAWSIVTGNGTISSSSFVTDAAGRASVTWTLGDVVGDQSVIATVSGLAGFGVRFSATATYVAPVFQYPIILHYDGNSWGVALQAVNVSPVALTSVWGASSSAVFAVGASCGSVLVLRYDGTAWDQPPQCSGGGLQQYTSVWGNSASDVFAVARAPLPPSLNTWIAHYDGQSWTNVYTHGCSFCSGVRAIWSVSHNDAIAVGDSGVILHYDGAGWTPQTSGATKNLNAVWGIGSGGNARIFAVGDEGTVRYFDGITWSAQSSGTSVSLYAVWGTSASDVFAVGGGGTILHYDGNAWTRQTSGSTQTIRGLWGNSGSSVYAVGDASTILYYDGTSWASRVAGASIDLRGVWGSSPTNIFAVGQLR